MNVAPLQIWIVGTCPFAFEAHRGVFLARALARENEVRYVHPLESTSLARRILRGRSHPLPEDLATWREEGPGLHHVSVVGHWIPPLAKRVPTPASAWSEEGGLASSLASWTWRLGEWGFGRWLSRELRRHRREGVPQVIVDACWSFSWSLRGAPADLLVYDCCDNWAAYPGEHPARAAWGEGRLARMSDCVVVSSFSFGERMRRFHPDVTHIPNGVPQEVLARPAPQGAIPERRASGRPVVLYHGQVTPFRFDWPLLLGTARACPELDFRILTDPRQVPSGLGVPSNVRIEGWVRPSELGAVIAGASLGFMPYVLAEPTLSGFPLKMFEYLAMGLPVVSTPLHEVLRYGDAVTPCGTDPAEAAAAIRREIALDSQERREARRRLAEENAWERLAERYVALIRARLEARSGERRRGEGSSR